MSQQEPTGDTGQPTEEQVRAYLSELREADATDIVVQAVSLLLNGAQVKLGRPDARMLVDAAGGLLESAGPRLGERLTKELRGVLSQLRVAQVEAEQEEGEEGQPAGGGERATPRRPPEGGEEEAGEADRTSSRLWTPPGAGGS